VDAKTTRQAYRALVFFVIWALHQGPAKADPLYTITDLGTLPGQTDSIATGINGQGQVVGVSASGIDLSGNAWPHVNTSNNSGASSFLYNGGQLSQLNPIGGSPAQSINDAGQVVGGGYSSINNSSQYVDRSSLVTGGTTISLGNFGAYAINDSGEIAGSFHPQGVYGPTDVATYQAGHVTDLSQSLGLNSQSGAAYAINNAGDLLFYYTDSNGHSHYMFYSHDGHASTLPLGNIVGQGGPGLPAALNNVGQIVGDNFLFSNGTTYILNSLIPQNSHWGPDLLALAINDAGQIVGAGQVGDHLHAFLMTPAGSQEVPEPSTLAVLGTAVCWLMINGRWRRKRNG
jgi:uncharacterized membrane protein